MKLKLLRIAILLALLILAACNSRAENDIKTSTENYAMHEGDETAIETADAQVDDFGVHTQSPGKIAIITTESEASALNNSLSESWLMQLIEKYGADRIAIYTWPRRYANSPIDETVEMINEIANNHDIGVLVINPAFHGTDHIIAILNEQRDDIFVIYLDYQITSDYVDSNSPFRANTLADAAYNANLIIDFDTLAAVAIFPQKALELGADTLVYFYDTSSLWDWGASDEDFNESVARAAAEYEQSHQFNILREKSKEAGLKFISIDIAGAIQCGSSYHTFMIETVPPLIEEHGTDIVLFGLDNERVFWDWRTHGFIYIPPRPGSWFELTPKHFAWELPVGGYHDLSAEERGNINTIQLVEEIRTELEKRDLLGRMAAPPMSTHLLFPLAAAEYGIRWTNDEVEREGIDIYVLEQIMAEIIQEHTGLQHGATARPLYEDSIIHENFILVLPDYLVY